MNKIAIIMLMLCFGQLAFAQHEGHNTSTEQKKQFRYIVNKYFSLSTHYDSDMGYGGGLTITY